MKINKNQWKNDGFCWILKVRASKKPSKIDAKMRSKKTLQKKLPKIDFSIHFSFPKPPKIIPKSFEIAPQSDAERSLFRDAMEIANKSSQVNGERRL